MGSVGVMVCGCCTCAGARDFVRNGRAPRMYRADFLAEHLNRPRSAMEKSLAKRGGVENTDLKANSQEW